LETPGQARVRNKKPREGKGKGEKKGSVSSVMLMDNVEKKKGLLKTQPGSLEANFSAQVKPPQIHFPSQGGKST